LESSDVVTAAVFNTVFRHFWAIDHRSDVIELTADKEIFCGVQININEAKNAYFQIYFH